MALPFILAGGWGTIILGSIILCGLTIGVTYLWVDLKRDQLEYIVANDAEQDARDAETIASIKQSCIEDELSTYDCNARLIEYYNFIAKCDAADLAEFSPSLLENAAKYFGTSVENMKYIIIAAILALILTRG